MNPKLIGQWAQYFVCNELTGSIRPLTLKLNANSIEGGWYADQHGMTYDTHFVDENFTTLVQRMRKHLRQELEEHKRQVRSTTNHLNFIEETVKNQGKYYGKKSRDFAIFNRVIARSVLGEQRQGPSRAGCQANSGARGRDVKSGRSAKKRAASSRGLKRARTAGKRTSG